MGPLFRPGAGSRSSLGRRRGGRDRGAGRLRRVIPAPPIPRPYPRPSSPSYPRPTPSYPRLPRVSRRDQHDPRPPAGRARALLPRRTRAPPRRPRLDLGPKPKPLRRTEAPSSRPTPFAGTPGPGLAHGRRIGPRSSLGRRRGGRDRGAGRLRRVIPAPPIPPIPAPLLSVIPAPHSATPAPLPVAPDLIWGPNPTRCAGRRPRAAGRRRSRELRGLVSLTDAVWAPDQVWGDGRGGRARQRGGAAAPRHTRAAHTAHTRAPPLRHTRVSFSVLPAPPPTPSYPRSAAGISMCAVPTSLPIPSLVLPASLFPSYPRLPRSLPPARTGVSRRDQHRPPPTRRPYPRPPPPPHPRPLSVAPDLIWGPNPTRFAGQRPRAAGRRRSRELRGLVSLTDAVWAPDQVWGDGGEGATGGRGGKRRRCCSRRDTPVRAGGRLRGGARV